MGQNSSEADQVFTRIKQKTETQQLLEDALFEYVLKYGLSDKARIALDQAMANRQEMLEIPDATNAEA